MEYKTLVEIIDAFEEVSKDEIPYSITNSAKLYDIPYPLHILDYKKGAFSFAMLKRDSEWWIKVPNGHVSLSTIMQAFDTVYNLKINKKFFELNLLDDKEIQERNHLSFSYAPIVLHFKKNQEGYLIGINDLDEEGYRKIIERKKNEFVGNPTKLTIHPNESSITDVSGLNLEIIKVAEAIYLGNPQLS